RRQTVILTVRPAILERDVAAFDIAGLAQTLMNGVDIARVGRSRRRSEKPDHGHRALLRARDRGPCERGHGRADERYECAPVHSIASSASASSLSGTARPSAFAVLRLMTSSNLVGRSNGMSLGVAPLSTRSSCDARRR